MVVAAIPPAATTTAIDLSMAYSVTSSFGSEKTLSIPQILRTKAFPEKMTRAMSSIGFFRQLHDVGCHVGI